MSDAPKKRPWLQFHISTAIIMMFVAGGLMWLNLHGRADRVYPGCLSDALIPNRTLSYGWPLPAVWTYYEPGSDQQRTQVLHSDVAADLGFAALAALAAGYVLERRSRKEPRQ